MAGALPAGSGAGGRQIVAEMLRVDASMGAGLPFLVYLWFPRSRFQAIGPRARHITAYVLLARSELGFARMRTGGWGC